MKENRILMGMPISVEVREETNAMEMIAAVFAFFQAVDAQFSVYKSDSEISRFNRGEVRLVDISTEMREIFRAAQETKELTDGYFNIMTPSGSYNPSGLVKGWAIYQASWLLKRKGALNFCVEAGGDLQVSLPVGFSVPWTVGIRNPFESTEIIKTLKIRNEGVATSGTYVRGQHIYDPHHPAALLTEIVSLTVIGPNIYEADRFATAAFAMGAAGINFIARCPGLEAYQIDKNGQALMTSGFVKYLAN